MNMQPEARSFRTKADVLRYLHDLPAFSGEKVAIVAGHFMLMYDDRNGELVPMVYQDADNPSVEWLSKTLAGDFPLSSFELGCKMQRRYAAQGADAGIVLIVNDHVFTTPGWRKQNLDDVGRAAALRHSFYRKRYPLPRSFFQMLRGLNMTSAAIMDNNNPRRTQQNILPKLTRMYSEQALRNNFDKYTRRQLSGLAGFTEERTQGSKVRLLFTGGAQPACLTDGHGCGCSGELIEFLRELAQRGIEKIVFFVPNECKAAAEIGFQAFMTLPAEHTRNLVSICSVAGISGTEPVSGGFTAKLHRRTADA